MDYLTSFIIWVLGVYGMSTIIVNSLLFKPFREFLQFSQRTRDEKGILVSATERRWSLPGKLITCIMCMSFWCGVFQGVFMWSPFCQSDANWFVQAIFNGCVGSGSTWLIYLWVADRMGGK